MISAFVAFTIFGITALVLDRAHLLSAPIGVIEVHQPSPVEALDEVVVVARQ